MPDAINEYNTVVFGDRLAAISAAEGVMNHVSSPIGSIFMTGSRRAVIWTTPALSKNPTLFLSDGAVEAAAAAGISIPKPQRIARAQLPSDRSLLLGDEDDWST